MYVARVIVASALATIALGGCGDDARTTPRAGHDGLSAAPPAVARGCALAARRVSFPVLCPSRWPAGTGRVEHDFSVPPSAYLLDFSNGFALHGAKVFHVLLGGQERSFGAFTEALRISKLQQVPMRGGGTFVAGLPPRQIGTADVNGARARVLSEPRYPQGGLHGGHVVVAWNADGHGYLVSLHASRMARAEQVELAVGMARSAVAVSASPRQGT